MRSFLQWLNEEILRNINLSKAIQRSGLSQELLSNAKGVITVNQFIANPPPDTKGAYALGLSMNLVGPPLIYSNLIDAHQLKGWMTAYSDTIGTNYHNRLREPNITQEFMDKLTSLDKPLVFFVPSEPSNLGKYTREELDYLTKNPERAKNVYFVLGAYDMISSDDYRDVKKHPDYHNIVKKALVEPQNYTKQEEF